MSKFGRITNDEAYQQASSELVMLKYNYQIYEQNARDVAKLYAHKYPQFSSQIWHNTHKLLASARKICLEHNPSTVPQYSVH